MGIRMVRMPDVGEGVAEAEVVEWHVAVGDHVSEDQIVAAVMTDKATVEIPAPCHGTVVKLGGGVGETIAVGGELMSLDVEDGVAAGPRPELPIETPPPTPTSPGGGRSPETRGPRNEAGDLAADHTAGDPLQAPTPPAPTSPGGGRSPETRGPRDEVDGFPSGKAQPDEPGSRPRVPGPMASPSARDGEAGSVAASDEPMSGGSRPLASPAVRRRAQAAGIDLATVRGSGPDGRILHEDLDAVLAGPRHFAGEVPSPRTAGTDPKPDSDAPGRVPERPADQPRTGAAPDGAASARPAAPRPPRAPDEVEEIRVIGLRRQIARRMAEAKRRAAHFTYVEEVDVTAVEELRASLNADGSGRPRLTLLPFVVRALVKALPDFPQMNAHFDDEAEVIRRFSAVQVGIATQTGGGLMVPVLRDAHARDLWNAAFEVKRLADSARNGTATRDELSGSTITITSLGPLGGIVATPVINLPEVAIVAVNKQVVRPVWRDGAFVPRTCMNISASFDHRVIDGHDAASFVQRLKRLLEQPATLFI